MGESVLLQTALRLPVPDVEALIQGRMIAAMPRKFINPGLQFALYPADVSLNLLPQEQHYSSNFLPIAQTALAQLGFQTVLIKAWARCELCQMLNAPESLEALSRLTVWTTEALQQTLVQQPYIFLAHLRVYQLPHPIEVLVQPKGQFVSLPHSLIVSEASPVLSDRIFAQRRHQLEKRQPPLHPELEHLQSAIVQMNNPAAQQMDYEIRKFLGWVSNPPAKQPDPDVAWIYTINALGTAITGGNFEKGTAFEQIVHKSLAFLGFGVDPNAKGGAGGMDLYCTTPYPLVGECKAGQSIPGNTVYELDKLGTIHLGKKVFDTAVKLIIGPGNPTPQLQKSAQEYIISIIHPMTLQKLVELQAKYPGSVNLIELKPYLEAGQIDYRIDEYIDKVHREIKLRSLIVQAVQELSDPGSEEPTVIVIRTHFNARFAQEHASKLDVVPVHDLLVELSSPLTGYLGRIRGSDWKSDRFYFLRDLQIS